MANPITQNTTYDCKVMPIDCTDLAELPEWVQVALSNDLPDGPDTKFATLVFKNLDWGLLQRVDIVFRGGYGYVMSNGLGGDGCVHGDCFADRMFGGDSIFEVIDAYLADLGVVKA